MTTSDPNRHLALVGTATILDELEQLLRAHGHPAQRHAGLDSVPPQANGAILDAAQLDALRAAQAELTAARAEFNTFAGRISHDLQSVMQNIEGFASVLQRQLQGKLSEKEAHYLDRVRKNAAQGNSMLHDLLGLSRLGINPVETQAVNLADAVRRSIRLLEPALKDRQVQWDLDALDALPPVHADATLLHQALGHLLGNAVKFTRNSQPARIGVRARLHDAVYEITVEDNGAGFDMSGVDRLFHPFERLHDAREFEGNGIGLAMVRRIAERHGGRAWAQAEPGQGARFTLALPQPAAGTSPSRSPSPSPPAGVAATAAPPSTPGAAPPGKLSIMLVDDDPLVLMSLSAMLETDGHRVTPAAGGQAALDELAARTRDGNLPQLVITDLGMPLVDGLQVALAAKAARPAPRVMLLSGRRPDGTGASLPEAVDMVLGKPIRLAQLRTALHELMATG